MRKGFTLIELLAVIVILAIIALIATPIILNIISDSKDEARERSIDNIIHTARIYAAKEGLEENEVVHIKDIKNMIEGEVPENGIIYFNKNGEVSFSLDFKDEVYAKSFEGKIEKETNQENADQISYLKVATTTNGLDQLFLEGPITKAQIEKVITVPTNKVPSDAKGSWDVSDQNNGKIMAWYTDVDSNELYEIYIGQTGGVKANSNSTKLFNYLTNATEIDVTYLDVGNVTNMSAMFQQCNNLAKIKGLENFDTSNVLYMSGMFNKCFKLQSINLKKFDTSKVIEMNQMFDNCQSLITLDVSSFDTSNVKKMNSMFTGCISLKEIDVSNFKTSKVENMKLMFGGANLDDVFYYMQLEKIKGLENFDTRAVTDMSAMFQMCPKLTTLDLRSFDTNIVTDMSFMFNGTTNLKPIYIGTNWITASTVTSMFRDSLTENEVQMCGPNSVHSYCVLN